MFDSELRHGVLVQLHAQAGELGYSRGSIGNRYSGLHQGMDE